MSRIHTIIVVSLSLAAVLSAPAPPARAEEAPPPPPDETAKPPAEPIPEELKALISQLRGGQVGERMGAVVALLGMGEAAAPATAALIDATRDPVPPVKIHAIQALGAIGPKAEKAVPALVEALKTGASPDVRWRAAEALGNIGPGSKTAIPALSTALTDMDPTVRLHAEAALKRIGPTSKATVTALLEALGDEDAGMRAHAARSLGEMGEKALPALPQLLEAVDDDYATVRLATVTALRKVGAPPKAIVRALIDRLGDEDVRVRSHAAEALADLGPGAKRALGPLMTLAREDGSPDVRLAAVVALGRIGAKEAVPALRDAVKDEDLSVRSVAGLTLAELVQNLDTTVVEVEEELAAEELQVTVARRILRALLFLLLAIVANLIAKQILVRVFRMVATRSQTKWDDFLVEHEVFYKLSHLAPAMVFYFSADVLFPYEPALASMTARIAQAYMVLAGALVANSFLNAAIKILEYFDTTRDKPVKSYVQVIRILVWMCAMIVLISIIINRNPSSLLTGLGAMTAVLMLIFKDSILGLVASIQISALDLVRKGDWIEMPKYNADGDVIDMSLTTIKIRNWDKTITAIPTYAVISDSFKNWRGMTESGGRRIKRSLNLDMNSVRFLDDELLGRLEKIDLLEDYLGKKKDEIAKWNQEHGVGEGSPVNGRHLTNLGTFRAYVEAYLRAHPMIRKDMTFLVRQLAPSAHGVGIEIYVFSADQRWAHYEGIMGDIFDHLIAALPEFGLRVYQEPGGSDFRRMFDVPGAAPERERVGAS